MVTNSTRPVLLARWLGRPFVLNQESIAWGRYVVRCLAFQELMHDALVNLDLGTDKVQPEKAASTFERVLRQFQPDLIDSFLVEKNALRSYEEVTKRVAASSGGGRSPELYYAERASQAAAFEDALMTVFNAAAPLHRLKAVTVARYRQRLHGMHILSMSNGDHKYEAAFTLDLVLECVDDALDWKRLWPPSNAAENF